MQPGRRVQQAIDAAYRVFAPYPRPTELKASPLRDADEILRTLTSAPLRDLTGEQIGPYAGWAMTTVGSAWDYKHFLPRILEQAVRRPVWTGTEPTIIASKLDTAGWQRWPATEQDAVRDVFAAAWAQTRAMHPDDIHADDWLCGIAALGMNVSEALAGWLSPPSRDAVLQLAWFIGLAPVRIFEGNDDEGGYWADVDPAARQSVAAWLQGDAVLPALLNLDLSADDKDRWLVDQALKVLLPTNPKQLN
jgi:hypothetical protein